MTKIIYYKKKGLFVLRRVRIPWISEVKNQYKGALIAIKPKENLKSIVNQGTQGTQG